MTITPKNWRDFQHYKDRNPPWIRLHKKLLDDFDFYSLPLASKALAPMLWLLASESVDGVISLTIQKIAFRVRMSESDLMEALKPLIDAGFFSMDQDASNMLAERQRDAVPMHCITETFTETETFQFTPPLAALESPIAELLPAKKEKRPEVETELQAACRETWASYSDAYRLRYGIDPVRNATVSSQVKQLVQRLGKDEARQVAVFYLSHNGAFYVRSTHGIGPLLKDCEALRTQWATGNRVTAAKANEADRLQTHGDGWSQLKQEARAKEAANAK